MLLWLFFSLLFYVYVFTYYLTKPLVSENWILSCSCWVALTYAFLSSLKWKNRGRKSSFYCIFIYVFLIFIHLIGSLLIRELFPEHNLFSYNFVSIMFNIIGVPIGIILYYLKKKN